MGRIYKWGEGVARTAQPFAPFVCEPHPCNKRGGLFSNRLAYSRSALTGPIPRYTLPFVISGLDPESSHRFVQEKRRWFEMDGTTGSRVGARDDEQGRARF